MVKIVRIGVLCIQGAVSEHIEALTQTFRKTGIPGTAISIRAVEDMDNIDGIIIPGGESTTISRILQQTGIFNRLIQRIQENDIAIMGTCAGCVLLANTVSNQTNISDIQLLQAMSMEVKRNAFGRQRESFEHPIIIDGLTKPYTAVFIRAPIITRYWHTCQPIGFFEKKIVAAKQGRCLAFSFHPELTHDTRLHQYFLELL